MRKTSFNGSAKPVLVTTAQTITFTGSDVEGDGVIAYHFVEQAAGNILSDIDRIRVKASGVTIYDVTMNQLRAMCEGLSPANLAPATTRQSFSIPFCLLDEFGEDRQDVCQFPRGASPTIEIVFNTGSAAGGLYCGWTKSSVTPQYYPRFLSSSTNLTASTAATNWRVNVADPGNVYGFTSFTTGLARLRLLLSGEEALNVQGAAAATGVGDMFLESQSLWRAHSITDPIYQRVTLGRPANPGSSYFEMDVSTAVVASTELALHALQRA
jgi:hypothetical protein